MDNPNDGVRARVKAIVTKMVSDPDHPHHPLTDDAMLFLDRTSDASKTLGLDSLDRVEMLLNLEEEFNVSITDDEVERLCTVNDIVELVGGKVGAAA